MTPATIWRAKWLQTFEDSWATRSIRPSFRATCACRRRRPTASRCCSTISNAWAARPICGSPPKSFNARGGCARPDLAQRRHSDMAEEAAKSRLGRGLAALIGDVGDENAVLERARAQRRLPIEF